MAITAPSRRWHTTYSMRELKQLELGKKSVFVNVGSGPGVHTVGAALRGALAIGLDTDRANVLAGRKLARHIALLGSKGGQELADMASLSGKESGKYLSESRGSAERAQFLGIRGDFPLKDDSANRILSLDYVHTLPPAARDRVLREILRIAKQGAVIRLMSKSYPISRAEFEGYRKEARRLGLFAGAPRKGYVMISAAEHFALLAAKAGAQLSFRLSFGRPTTFRVLRK